jgi:hypothetical protein
MRLVLNENLSNYELNETKKNIIELDNKITNFHIKTNLMILEYKNQLAKMKTSKMQNITYSGFINYKIKAVLFMLIFYGWRRKIATHKK